jgi:CheY-like chemotaxis protein
MLDEQIIDILLVEDNPNDEELTLRALRKHNLTNRVFVVRDGEEALEFLFRKGRYENQQESSRPRIVLLDLKLPKVDGLEVLRAVKSDESTRTIPVVVLTSSNQDRDIVESYRLGVNSYLVKPVEFENFIRSVSEIGYYWAVLNRPPVG